MRILLLYFSLECLDIFHFLLLAAAFFRLFFFSSLQQHHHGWPGWVERCESYVLVERTCSTHNINYMQVHNSAMILCRKSLLPFSLLCNCTHKKSPENLFDVFQAAKIVFLFFHRCTWNSYREEFFSAEATRSFWLYDLIAAQLNLLSSIKTYLYEHLNFSSSTFMFCELEIK